MRRFVVLTVLFSVATMAWLLLDADPEGRRDLVDRITNAFTDEEVAPPPNWGDVATKVGEFTEEERALREALNPPLGAAAPTPPAKLVDGP